MKTFLYKSYQGILMFDIITVGSATIDLFVNTENKLFLGKQGRIKIPFGSKIVISDLLTEIGGGGTNTAVAFSRLKLKTAYLGKIGTGNNSRKIIELLKKEKIKTSLIIRSPDGRTATSIILDAKDRDRTILTYRGTSETLNIEEVNLKKINSKWIYFASMTGDSFKTIEKLSDFAKLRNILVAFNPSSYLCKYGLNNLRKFIGNTDFLIMNKEEARMLLGNKEIPKMLKEFNSLGPNIVIISDGKNGAQLLNNNIIYKVKCSKSNVLETTGAGDSFASGFLGMYIKTNDIEDSLKAAILNSESVITHYGSKNKLLTYNEMLTLIKKRRIQITKKMM